MNRSERDELTPLNAETRWDAREWVRSEPPADDSPGPVALDAVACAALLTAAVCLLGWSSWRAYLFIPYADVHDWVAEVFATQARHDWMAYIWRPHTEQRIPIARVVQALDVQFGRGRLPSFLIAAWAAVLAGAASLGVVIWRSRAPVRLKLWTSCLAGLMLLNIGIAEDLAFPVFAVYPFVAGPALAAVAWLSLARGRGVASAALWLALAFAVLASFGNAAGLAVWPALLVCALIQGRPAAQLRVLLITGAVCICAVEAGLGVPSRSIGTATQSGLHHLLKMAAYFTVFGGLPWARSMHPALLAEGFGLGVELAALWGLVYARAQATSRYAPLQSTGVGMIVFGLATAALATLGRVDETAQAIVPTRYAPFAALIQAGAVLCWSPALDRLLKARRNASAGLLAAAATVALLLQLHGAGFLLRTADRIRAASAAFDAGAPTPDAGVVIYPDARRAAAIRAQMKARGLPY